MAYRCITVDTINGIQDAEYAAEKEKPNYDKWRDYGTEIYTFIKNLQKFGFEIVLVLGYEGTGKSYAMKGLEAGECLWFNTDNKNPTWKGGVSIFGTKNNPTEHQIKATTYNGVINGIKAKGKEAFGERKIAFLMGHLEDYKSGLDTRQRWKVLGNQARNLSIEGLMENTIYSEISVDGSERKYYFRVNNSGYDTCRTSEGLFGDLEIIPNNFKVVLDAIENYS